MSEVPADLRRLLPRFIQEFADARFMLITGCSVYAPLVYAFAKFPYGWERLVPPVMGPIIAALVLTIHPLNPYRSLYASLERIGTDSLEHDPAAQRLVRMFRSGRANRSVWQTAGMTSLTFFVLVVLTSRFMSPPLSWNIRFESIAGYSGLWAILSLVFLYHRLLRWAFREWSSAASVNGPDVKSKDSTRHRR